MKRKLLYLVIPIVVGVSYSDDLDTMLSKLGETREVKIPNSELKEIPSPMPKIIIVDNNGTGKDGNKTIAEEVSFKLKAIINRSANINDQWVKVGQKIEGYKLVDIMDDSVYLVDGNRSRLVFFDNNSTKIKIKLGR